MLAADYTTALTLLLRYPSPLPHTPQTFVHDALYLEQNPTADRGNFIISKYSGRPPEPTSQSQSSTRPGRKAFLWEDFKKRSESNSPAGSPARNSPKGFESLFQDVSQGIQRRTEAWGVAKAVRGAVTEARKNMQTMHYEPNLRHGQSRPVSAAFVPNVQSIAPSQASTAGHALDSEAATGLETRITNRNQTLATTLREVLDDLGSQLATIKQLDPSVNSAVKQALAKAESVQACLQDPSLPIDPSQCAEHFPQKVTLDKAEGDMDKVNSANTNTIGPTAESGHTARLDTASRTNTGRKTGSTRAIASRSAVRPSMSDSGFSWMLGGDRNLAGFVSSTSPPPEQTRHDQTRGKPSALFGSSGDENLGADAEHGELALHSLRGSRHPLSGAGPS